jgi:hypothetical protein
MWGVRMTYESTGRFSRRVRWEYSFLLVSQATEDCVFLTRCIEGTVHFSSGQNTYAKNQLAILHCSQVYPLIVLVVL